MSFLTDLWGKVLAKLGSFASFIPAIAAALKVAIANDDVEKVAAHLQQLDEAADAIKEFVTRGQAAIADGSLSLVEGSELALALERVVDELDDVVKGHDD